MNKYSLFIGRYQPLHAGHVALIRKVLDEGKNVLIAMRNTDRDVDNPHSLLDRRRMFEEAFGPEIKDGRMAIMMIADIDEVCYGRNVGWGIRQIKLDPETEAISATAIRKATQ